MSKVASPHIYKGNIVAGSLLVRESQVIARLLLNGVSADAWQKAIVIDNVLQKRTPETSRRLSRLIKSRLSLMQPELWMLIVQGAADVAIQALLAASIKHSPLLGGFMDKIIRSHWQTFKRTISAADWQDFLEMCVQIDPTIQRWSEVTRSKLKQVIFRILAEAKYVNNTRSLELLPVNVVPEVRQYLVDYSEDYVLRCMEITS